METILVEVETKRKILSRTGINRLTVAKVSLLSPEQTAKEQIPPRPAFSDNP